jgi:hypothetical protein
MQVLITAYRLLDRRYIDKAGCPIRAVSPGSDADKQDADEQQNDRDYDGQLNQGGT